MADRMGTWAELGPIDDPLGTIATEVVLKRWTPPSPTRWESFRAWFPLRRRRLPTPYEFLEYRYRCVDESDGKVWGAWMQMSKSLVFDHSSPAMGAIVDRDLRMRIEQAMARPHA